MAKKLPKRDYSKNIRARDMREMLDTSAAKYLDKPYLSWKAGDTLETLTYTAFADKVRALGTALYKHGLMGKRVAIISLTRWEYIAAYFAIMGGGGCVVPLDKELQPEQVRGFINLSVADGVIFSGNFKEMILSFRELGLEHNPKLIGLDEPEGGEDVLSYAGMVKEGEEMIAAGERAFFDTPIDENAMAALLFTSGTTGTSKGVMLSSKNLATSAYYAGVSTSFNSEMVMMSVLPVHHTYESVMGFFSTFMLGCHINICENIKMVMRSFNVFKPNAITLVPLFADTMYKKIWDEIGKKGKTKTVKTALALSNSLRKVGIDVRRTLFKDVLAAFGGNLKTIVCGGAPLNPAIVEGFESFGIDLYQGYGITECSPLVAVMPENIIKYASVGYPVPCAEVLIDKADPSEQTGEILVRGDSVMLGYMNDPVTTAEVMTEDGFFRTGDIGYLDEDGFLYITGRKKNVIVLNNGKNVFPEEVEEYISNCELVAESVVVGRTREDGSLVLIAMLYPNMEKFTDASGNVKTAEEIRAVLKAEIVKINKTLPTFKHIFDIEVHEEEFEKNTSRKIKRFLYK